MTRTTQVLKRLGVAGLVAATVGAGIPALAAMGASAATTYTTITLSPTNASSTAGSCTAYTATVSPGPSSTSETETVSVQIRQTANNNNSYTGTTAPILTFCTLPPNVGQAPNGPVLNESYTSNTSAPTTPTASSTSPSCQGAPIGANQSGNAGFTATSTTTQCEADFVTQSGRNTVTFGVSSNTLGTVGITAFQDTNPNKYPDTYEVQTPATDNIVSNAASNLACTPKAQSAQAGSFLDYTCTVTANGFVVNGADVRYVITAGPDQNTNNGSTAGQYGTSCASSTTQTASQSSNGQTICRVSNAGKLGTDSILFYVESDGQPGPQSGEASDTATGNFTGEARNISCAPKTQSVLSAGVSTVTCTVTDASGNPVAPSNGTAATSTSGSTASNTYVTFTSTGAGRFTDGNSYKVMPIGANGQASIQTTSQFNETGTQTVTGTLSDGGGSTSLYSSSATSECNKPAGLTNSNVFPAPTTAGNCSDSVTRTYSLSSSPSPSASSSASSSPSPSSSTAPAGRQTLGLTIDTPTIEAGNQATLTVTGSANQDIQLECYTRPSTTFAPSHATTIDAAGDAKVFKLSLGMNTRCFAEYVKNPGSGFSNQGVINVRTVISIFPVRNGFRDYTFQGHNLPKYTGQLITLYIESANGTTRKGNVKTDATGIYHIPAKFVGSGIFTFYVRTGQTLTNAAGESDHVSVSIH